MITNFRDIGGITVQSGILQEKIFFRSGELTELTESDKEFLEKDCQLKKVYDLRSKAEIKEKPDMNMPGVTIENLDILASAASNGASLSGMLNSKDIKGTMLETYTELVTSDSALKGYSEFLTEILQEKQAILFHCFAGKDRTGFAAALLLKIAGASEEQIVTDYLKTNTERKAANEKIIASMKDQLTAAQMNVLQIGLVVDESYLLHAKDVLVEKFGSFENYLLNGLKLQQDYVQQFRNMYVATI